MKPLRKLFRKGFMLRRLRLNSRIELGDRDSNPESLIQSQV